MRPQRITLIGVTLAGVMALGNGVNVVTAPAPADIRELWIDPADLANRDFFGGPWGPEHAPDPRDLYTFIESKRDGINPGMTVRDSRGREWKVKQPPNTGRNAEGPIEVALSRVLSGVGYHQPPVYYLPALRMTDGKSVYQAVGGRLRLSVPKLKSVSDWAWRANPFIGTKPFQGLLVMLLMFNSSDLKDSNNTLYEDRRDGAVVPRWYVVRDLGTALGSTARLTPIRGDPDVFEKLGFIKRIENGFVEFHYNGRHQPVVDGTIRPEDVYWAARLLARVSDRQWDDAFRAGGFTPDVRGRFIAKLKSKIRDGLALLETN
jgi:hypothetical protein